MERKDSRTKYPSALEEYLSEFGYHFNERLYKFAVSMMESRDGDKIPVFDKEKVDSFLRANNVTLDNNLGHDAAYVLAMAKADYYGSSITDERHLALFIKDFCDDPDGAETKAFDHFYIDCVAKGIPIFWDEMI